MEWHRSQSDALPLRAVECHVQYDVVVLDQHELAVLRRRDDDELLQPDGRADGSELPVGGRRHRRRGRARPRHHRPQRQEPGQLLAGHRAHRPVRAHAGVDRGRAGARLPGRDRELQLVSRRPRDHRADPGRRDGAGRLSGGDQAARHQRWRVLQRQFGAPVRESDRVQQLRRDAGGPAHSGGAGVHVRQDGRQPPPGIRDLLDDDDHVPRGGDRRLHRRGSRQPGAACRRPAHPRGRWLDRRQPRGQGTAVRDRRLGAVQRDHHRHVVRRGRTARWSRSPGSAARSRSPTCPRAR